MSELAGRWIRVSTGAQDERSQVPDLDAWISARGYELAATYEVHGKSAYHGKHESYLDRAIADMAAGRISVLVVWAADRIERRGALAALKLAERAREAGGRIEYVKDAYLNATNEMSDVMLSLSATLARQESKRKSERILAKHAALRVAGNLVGKVPFGYRAICDDESCATVTTRTSKCRKHAKLMVPDPETSGTVARIFDLFSDGYSLSAIARELDASGMLPGHGGKWWPKSIAEILSNPAYVGRRANERGVTVGEVPAIVRPGQWQDAQRRLAATGTRKGKPTGEAAQLVGVARCARCKGPMYRIRVGGKRSPNKIAYYRCWGTSREPSRCGLMIRCDVLEAAVSAAIVAELGSGPLRVTRTIPGHGYEDEIGACDLELANLMARLQSGELEASQYAAAVATVAAQRQDYATRKPVPARSLEIETELSRSAQWLAFDAAQRREYLTESGWLAYCDKLSDGTVTAEMAG